MLHAKFQDHRNLSCGEDFQSFFSYMDMAVFVKTLEPRPFL